MSFICEETEPMPIRHLTESSLASVSSMLAGDLGQIPGLAARLDLLNDDDIAFRYMQDKILLLIREHAGYDIDRRHIRRGLLPHQNTTRGTSLPKCSSRDLM